MKLNYVKKNISKLWAITQSTKYIRHSIENSTTTSMVIFDTQSEVTQIAQKRNFIEPPSRRIQTIRIQPNHSLRMISISIGQRVMISNLRLLPWLVSAYRRLNVAARIARDALHWKSSSFDGTPTICRQIWRQRHDVDIYTYILLGSRMLSQFNSPFFNLSQHGRQWPSWQHANLTWLSNHRLYYSCKRLSLHLTLTRTWLIWRHLVFIEHASYSARPLGEAEWELEGGGWRQETEPDWHQHRCRAARPEPTEPQIQLADGRRGQARQQWWGRCCCVIGNPNA